MLTSSLAVEQKSQSKKSQDKKASLGQNPGSQKEGGKSSVQISGLYSHFMVRSNLAGSGQYLRVHFTAIYVPEAANCSLPPDPVHRHYVCLGNKGKVWQHSLPWCSKRLELIGTSWLGVGHVLSTMPRPTPPRWAPYTNELPFILWLVLVFFLMSNIHLFIQKRCFEHLQ